MVLVASLYELSRASSPSGLLHGANYGGGKQAQAAKNEMVQTRRIVTIKRQ